jgi:hypothetical protein
VDKVEECVEDFFDDIGLDFLDGGKQKKKWQEEDNGGNKCISSAADLLDFIDDYTDLVHCVEKALGVPSTLPLGGGTGGGRLPPLGADDVVAKIIKGLKPSIKHPLGDKSDGLNDIVNRFQPDFSGGVDF